jgi:AcrR family transcriptional regulator
MKLRGYRMVARAASAEETARRIREAARDAFVARDFDQVTLEEIARAAGVTLQTVLRRFGSKEALLEAAADDERPRILASRLPPGGGVAPALRRLVDSYEAIGHMGWRMLRQEELPQFHALLVGARRLHRGWLERVFAGVLDGQPRRERARRLTLLFGATDYYLYKLWRRDLGHSRAATLTHMQALVDALLGQWRGS